MVDFFSRYYSRTNSERLIAAGRLILAVLSFVAICVDPSEPSRHAELAYIVLGGYVLCAGFVVALLWSLPACPRGLPMSTHGIDLAMFFAFVYFAEGHTSPFFVFFAFSLICATLRWHWPGTLWTGIVAIAGFMGIGVYTQYVLHDPAFELNHFIIRSVYLMVLVVLLTYLATYRWRLQRELLSLAAWPAKFSTGTNELLRELLQHSAATMKVPRVMLFWQERLTGSFHVATWVGGRFEWKTDCDADSQPVVAESLAGASFLYHDLRAATPRGLFASSKGFEFWHGLPFSADFQTRYGINDAALCSLLSGESVQGRLCFLDRRSMNSDDLVLAEVVARMVAARMDNLHLLKQLQESAAADVRSQLSNKLHDSLLQSLAVMGMQLEIVGRLFQKHPKAAKEGLAKIQDLLFEGSQDLRAIVTELKPKRAVWGASSGSAESVPERFSA